MDSLPKLTITMRETNPDYVPIYQDGEVTPSNMHEYQNEYEIEVEVVQLNLNSGGMRVRYQWPTKRGKKGYEIRSRDVSIEEFFKHYNIVEK